MYILDYLRSRGVRFEALLHRPASSSARRAGSIHVSGRCVGKTVLIKAGDAFVVVVLPSTTLIDLDRLSEALGTSCQDVRLATTAEVARIFPDCEPGVVPPFGRLYGLSTVVDASLMEFEQIVLGGNLRHEGLRITWLDFEAIEHPVPASFTRPIAVRKPPSANREHKRRAG
jgi:Ala-tRNA(Pro) deacylase